MQWISGLYGEAQFQNCTQGNFLLFYESIGFLDHFWASAWTWDLCFYSDWDTFTLAIWANQVQTQGRCVSQRVPLCRNGAQSRHLDVGQWWVNVCWWFGAIGLYVCRLSPIYVHVWNDNEKNCQAEAIHNKPDAETREIELYNQHTKHHRFVHRTPSKYACFVVTSVDSTRRWHTRESLVRLLHSHIGPTVDVRSDGVGKRV